LRSLWTLKGSGADLPDIETFGVKEIKTGIYIVEKIPCDFESFLKTYPPRHSSTGLQQIFRQWGLEAELGFGGSISIGDKIGVVNFSGCKPRPLHYLLGIHLRNKFETVYLVSEAAIPDLCMLMLN
jgi:hypothetical protein